MRLKRPRFKTVFILLLLAIIAIPIVLVTLVTLGLESNPLVVPGKKLTFQDVERIKQILKENNPRRLQAGEIKRLTVTERDLNLLIYYSLSHSPLSEKLNTRINFYPNSADIHFTYTLLDNPFGAYLNVSAVLSKFSGAITIDKLDIGALTVPGWLINPMVQYAHRHLQRYEEYRSIIEGLQAIKDIHLYEKKVLLVYQWQPDVAKQLEDQGRDWALPHEEKKRLLAYWEQLSIMSRTVDGQSVSLSKFFQPLFLMAKERTVSGGDPVAENRALILGLAIYSTGRNLDRVVGRPHRVTSLTIVERDGQGKIVSNRVAKSDQRPVRVNLTLLERRDLALHFLVSAAVTVSAGGGMADLLGVFKELDDAQGGSGFSFADLAADQAGVRLGKLAMGSPHARLLQQRMNQELKETDFMPRVEQLPESIMELEFKRRYRDLDSATYKMVDDEIERRIAECRIYK